jgi:hypothetical protein
MPASRLKSLGINDRLVENKSRLNQLIDIISADVSNTVNRRTYPAFVTGNTYPVTSSLFNTIYDQDNTLQSSNALFDMTFGLYAKTVSVTQNNITTKEIQGSQVITTLTGESVDSSGFYYFNPLTSSMIREKINIYKQYAQSLLGNANEVFKSSYQAPENEVTEIKEALFLNFKRLFKRDNIARGTFGLTLYNRLGDFSTIAVSDYNLVDSSKKKQTLFTSPNTVFGSVLYTGKSALQQSDNATDGFVTIIDTNASNVYSVLPTSGEVATLKMFKDDPSVSIDVGLIFYDAGVVVLDVSKVFKLSETVKGVISFPDASTTTSSFGGFSNSGTTTATVANGEKALNNTDTLLKFLQLATIDDIVKHFCEARFADSNNTCLTFQNETIINSTIFFCNAAPSEFNYSTNPTYIDEYGKINVVRDTTSQPFSYITTVGLYDAAGNLLAVAKLSRPIEKNPNNNLTIRVRLDY